MLGIDIGNSTSKQTLCFLTENDRGLQLARVPFEGPYDHPDRPAPGNAFEISSLAGLDDQDAVVVGGAALAVDRNFSIKSSGIARALPESVDILAQLPRGEELRKALSDGALTHGQIAEIMRRHYSLLRDMALRAAAKHGVRIAVLALTHPDFLRPSEGSRDFEVFMGWVVKILLSVWGEDFRIEFVSEGQATVRYICELFYDSATGAKSHHMPGLFGDEYVGSQRALVVVDWGSISMV